jgi:hypothetical protein
MSISPSSSPPNSSRSEYVSPHFGGDVVPKITAGKENFFVSQLPFDETVMIIIIITVVTAVSMMMSFAINKSD